MARPPAWVQAPLIPKSNSFPIHLTLVELCLFSTLVISSSRLPRPSCIIFGIAQLGGGAPIAPAVLGLSKETRLAEEEEEPRLACADEALFSRYPATFY